MKKYTGRIKEVEKVWLSSREVRAYLDCSDDYLQKLRDEASISFSRIGNKYWYDLRSIDLLLRKNIVV